MIEIILDTKKITVVVNDLYNFVLLFGYDNKIMLINN